jgi:hypothetical protein
MAEVVDRIFVKSDVGNTLKMATGLDLTSYVATDLTIKVSRPDATTFNMTDTRAIDDASSGRVSVKFATGNLDQEGEYLVQVYASGAGLASQRSPVMSFYVESSL